MPRSPAGGVGRLDPSSLLRRRSIAAAACIAVAAVAVGVAAGRGGGGSTAQPPATAPACAHATSYVDRPDSVPSELLPKGTALTSRMNLPRHQTLVTGVIPLDFRNAVAFYASELPRRGYQLGGGDAEMSEAEAVFLGAAVHGKWKVNGIPNCPKAVLLSLLVTR